MQSCFRVSYADRVVIGEMLEWLKRHAWKACILLKGIRSSNLLLSANVMKLGASRRAFSFEGRQELAPVKAFKCKSPTASGRELHDACKGPSGKEQRKGTRSVANLVNAIQDSITCLQLAVFSQSGIYLDKITLCLSASSNSQFNSQSSSPARWFLGNNRLISHIVHTLFRLKRFRGTKRL